MGPNHPQSMKSRMTAGKAILDALEQRAFNGNSRQKTKWTA